MRGRALDSTICRRVGRTASAFASSLALVTVSCGNNGAVSYQQGFDAGALVDHAVAPLGVGGACSPDQPCRTGLVCTAGACAPGHATPVGQPCTIDDECAPGNYCNGAHQCGPGGSGTPGSACGSDANCAAGLRCDPSGLSATCQPEGGGDVGGACMTGADCFGGLGCVNGVCAQAPLTPGAPPPVGIATWTGAQCTDDSGPTKAYFQLPRAGDDGGAGTDFFRLPFPNDARRNGTRPDLTGFPTPGAEILGYDLVARYVADVEANTDGFSTYPTVVFRFSAPVDFASLKLPQTLQWLELSTTGATPLGFEWAMTTGRDQYLCNNALTARPPQGQPLKPGTTYAFVITQAASTGTGPIQSDPDFLALVAATAPTDPVQASAYAAYAPLRAWAAANGGASTLVTGTVFTTAHTNALVPSAIAAVNAAAAPTATSWVNCASGSSPCPQATGARACGAADPAFYELHAIATLPILQGGTEPYADVTQGGDIARDGNGAAQVVRSEQVCLSLTVPKTTMPAAGWPLVVYAHGTGGSFRSQVTEGVAANLAAAKNTAGVGTAMAVLGIDQVETGTRRGASMDSPDNLFYNFANPGAARGNPVQGAADQASLLRLAKSLALDPTLTGGAAFKVGAIAFWGHSQGATEGGIALPYVSGYAGAVLSGEGASLIDALLTKTNPVDVADVVPFVLEDPAVNAYHPVLGLLQAALDQADPINHAAALAFAPPGMGGAKHIFQPYGLGDTYAPTVTQATFAIAAHLGVAAASASVTTPDAIGGASPVPVPASGNLMVGGKPVTAFVREYQPSGYDGHFVAFQNADAEADVARFLADVVSGKVPTVGP